jgi:hypothetical protein
MPCKIHSLFLFVLLVSGFFLGCGDDDVIENASVPRLFVEMRGVNYGSLGGEVMTLPVSGTSIAVHGEPLMTEFDIRNVELVKVDMGLALLLQVTPSAARQLYRASVSNMGGRIVLAVNGTAIGARRIDGAIQDGNFYTFVEVDDAELEELVLNIKETLSAIREKAD